MWGMMAFPWLRVCEVYLGHGYPSVLGPDAGSPSFAGASGITFVECSHAGPSDSFSESTRDSQISVPACPCIFISMYDRLPSSESARLILKVR
jgi:hypothetical protein